MTRNRKPIASRTFKTVVKFGFFGSLCTRRYVYCLWEALTKANLTEKHWFGYRVSADGKPGDYMTAKDRPVSRPTMIPFWRAIGLDVSCTAGSHSQRRAARASIAGHFELKPIKGQTRLSVTHDDFDEGSKIFEMISGGWPAVLSSLKSFLETGQGLEPTWIEEEKPWLK